MNKIAPYLIEFRREPGQKALGEADWRERVSNVLLKPVRIHKGEVLSVSFNETDPQDEANPIATTNKVIQVVSAIFAYIGYLIPYNWIGMYLCKNSESHSAAYEKAREILFVHLDINSGNIEAAIEDLIPRVVDADPSDSFKWDALLGLCKNAVNTVKAPVEDYLAERLLELIADLAEKAPDDDVHVADLKKTIMTALVTGSEGPLPYRYVGKAFIFNEKKFARTDGDLTRSTPVGNNPNWSKIEDGLNFATHAEEVRFCSNSSTIPIHHLRQAGTIFGTLKPDLSTLHDFVKVTFADEKTGLVNGLDRWMLRKLAERTQFEDLHFVREKDFREIVDLIYKPNPDPRDEDLLAGVAHERIGELRTAGDQINLLGLLPEAVQNWKPQAAPGSGESTGDEDIADK